MKILILVNYMKSNPTIIDDIVEQVKNDFESIYVCNRKTKDSYSKIKALSNVRVYEISNLIRLFYIFFTPFKMINKDVFYEIWYAIKTRVFGYRFIKALLKHYFVTYQLHHLIKNTIKQSKSDEISLFSIWYTGEANAIALIKKKRSNVKSISMAHAHDIVSFDNLFTFIGKKFTQSVLDSIIFISKEKLNTFNFYVSHPHNLRTDNIKQIYWGSKYFDFTDKLNSEKKFLVSCSTVEGLKRVDQIAKAVSMLDVENVEWHHFGDGVEMDNLKKVVKNLKADSKVKLILHGRIDNYEVKRFYSSNNAVLFINFSTTEGLPISVMEALSYRIPALVTDVGGEKEIIVNDYNGYIVDVNTTVNDLANKIKEHLRLNNESLSNMKSNSYKVWNEKFNLEKNIKDYVRILS